MSDTPKLPVWRTVAASWHFALEHWLRLVLTGLPLIVPFVYFTLPDEPSFGPTLLEEPFFGPVLTTDQPSLPYLPPGRFVLSALLYWLPFALLIAWLMVPVQRLALLGDRGPFPYFPFRLGGRELRFMLAIVALWIPYWLYSVFTWLPITRAFLGLFAASPMTSFTAASAAAVLVLLLLPTLAIWWLEARLSLIFPAIAADRERPLTTGWQLGRRNGWRLLVLLAAAPIPVILAYALLEGLDRLLVGHAARISPDPAVGTVYWATRPAVWTWVYTVGIAVSYWGVVALQATALSLCYRRMGGMDKHGGLPQSGGR